MACMMKDVGRGVAGFRVQGLGCSLSRFGLRV